MTRLVAALVFLALDLYVFHFFASEEVIPARESFASFPRALPGWHCDGRETMDPKALRVLGATDYWLCNYRSEDAAAGVSLYVGYHESQVRQGGGGGETVIHPPEHCLPGSGWAIVDASRSPLEFAGLPQRHGIRDAGPTAKRFVIAKGDARQLVYFWYQGQGRVLSANEDVILYRFWNRATRRRTDGALVRFTTPILRGDTEAAEERFRRFAAAAVPALPLHLPE